VALKQNTPVDQGNCMSAKDEAKKLVDEFEMRNKPGCPWIYLKRSEIAAGLRERIDDPDKINQGQTSLCGPADFIRDVAIDFPKIYAQAAIDLYEIGQGLVGTFLIKPAKDLKLYKLPETAKIHQADWLVLASIRDTDNWFMDYQSESDDAAAITMPHSKESWLRKAGYSDVVNETNILACKDLPNARKASSYLSKGYKVCLFINADMLDTSTQNNSSVTPNHWVALTSSINVSGIEADPASKMKFRVYTWGAQQDVPASGSLNIKHFLSNYYGYIACKL
jgi:hypothetical protein